jgi:hypothetical protein
MFQALPIMHWVYGPDKSDISIEMTDDLDNKATDNSEKEQVKECKENIIPYKYLHNKHLSYKFSGLSFLASENAIILHHADINTPPPDING